MLRFEGRAIKNRCRKDGRNSMTRNECEQKIAEKLLEIKEIYHQYNSSGEYMHLVVTNDYISAVNEYYGEDFEKPIDFKKYEGEPIQSRKHGGNETE